MARGDGGIGKSDPWPTTDQPFVEENPCPHYDDGYMNRAPGGGHIEAPTDYWLDCMVYPYRDKADSAAQANRMDMRSRSFRITAGNMTGKDPGPSED